MAISLKNFLGKDEKVGRYDNFMLCANNESVISQSKKTIPLLECQDRYSAYNELFDFFRVSNSIELMDSLLERSEKPTKGNIAGNKQGEWIGVIIGDKIATYERGFLIFKKLALADVYWGV